MKIIIALKKQAKSMENKNENYNSIEKTS